MEVSGEDVPLMVERASFEHLGAELMAASQERDENFTVENDVIRVEFSTFGGVVRDVVLKDYTTFNGGPLHLWSPGSNYFNLKTFLPQGQVDTGYFNFQHTVTARADATVVSMRLPVDSLGHIEFLYTIPREGYMIDFDVRLPETRGGSFDIDWHNTSLQNERGFDNENNYTTIAYRYPGVKSVEQLGIARAGAKKDKSEDARVEWVAFKQQFFSSVLIADGAFGGVDMAMSTHDGKDGEVKDFSAALTVPVEGESYGFRFYFGPNKFSVMKGYGLGMERMIALGWMSFGWISRGALIPLFEWISGWGIGIGWVILLMTFIIKLVISPLTFTSYVSSAKMRIIRPEVDQINAKYPKQDDAMKKQQATMELYRKAGINPLAGCIPMLIQFPIMIAMFRFFPAAIELRGESLWWATDLSSYDSILQLPFNIPFYGNHVSLFALLMAVSLYFTSVLNFRQQSAQPQMAGMKFMMLYFMPLFTLFLLNNFSSGLCYYYLLGNLFTILQMYAAKWIIDEDKLHQKMNSRPVKAKKKSAFMQRLEEAQRAQAQQAAQQKRR